MPNVKVQAIMTAPRYEATWARNCIELSLRTLGIPLSVSGGVYYGQCMQQMMEDAIKADVEYLITVDGDSVFTADEVSRLLSLTVQEDFDALCSLQLRRGKAYTLGFKEGQSSATWTGYPIQVDSAHFGLTVLKVANLANVKKPWFFCKPNENGEWRGNKIDSDIWFWMQWKEAGYKCWIDPGCRVGHLEEMIACYDEEWQPTHLYPAEWRRRFGNGEADEKLEEVSAGETA
jgi:hypothetical protein